MLLWCLSRIVTDEQNQKESFEIHLIHFLSLCNSACQHYSKAYVGQLRHLYHAIQELVVYPFGIRSHDSYAC